MDAVCPEAHPDHLYQQAFNTWFLVQHYQRVMLAAWNMANSSKPFASISQNCHDLSKSSRPCPTAQEPVFQRGTIKSSWTWPSGEVWGGVLNSSFIIDDEIAISETLLMVEDVAWTTTWIQSIVIMLTVIAKVMMDLLIRIHSVLYYIIN